MNPVKSSHTLGTVARAFDLLVGLAGGLEAVLRCFQRLIDDPVYRRQVWLAMTGQLVLSDITAEGWVERELNCLRRLGRAKEEGAESFPTPDEAAVRHMAENGNFGFHRYYVPGGLTRAQLLDFAREAGAKMNSSPDAEGDQIPTEVGVLECDLAAIMTPTDATHRPFNLNAEEQESWSAEQGGEGLTSAEEALYLVYRAFLAFGRIPFMGGWIRCRNRHQDGDRLLVGFFADGGLRVDWDAGSRSRWPCGAVARKFLEA